MILYADPETCECVSRAATPWCAVQLLFTHLQLPLGDVGPTLPNHHVIPLIHRAGGHAQALPHSLRDEFRAPSARKVLAREDEGKVCVAEVLDVSTARSRWGMGVLT
jgi:hypothetical protein